MTEETHEIRVKSLQEWRGGFNGDIVGEDYQMDLEFQEEISISFTCDCGEKFYKKENAEEHLLEND